MPTIRKKDPLTVQPHEPDVSALLRLCDVHNIPLATNLATAEVMVKAPELSDLDCRMVYFKIINFVPSKYTCIDEEGMKFGSRKRGIRKEGA